MDQICRTCHEREDLNFDHQCMRCWRKERDRRRLATAWLLFAIFASLMIYSVISTHTGPYWP